MHIIMTTDFDFEKLTMLLGLISGVTWMVISLLLQNHCKETGQYRKEEPALKSLLVNNFK